ncbi:ShlB/FhaC/HecB family hemolysin secretion/activation protein [Rhodoferax sp.]|uniref:ShlB/FhaC/HecB family hemolysin secretion/activation protein n=1 Tax=Rhodoferax sp. TaxID=50421 RepID=UPI00374DA276
MSHHPLQLALLVTAGLASFAASAQSIVIPPAAEAGALQQRQIDEERRRRELERTPGQAPDPLQRPAAPVAPAQLPAGGISFEVREIRFWPSEILSLAELEAIASQYRGRRLTLNELQEMAGKVNALYKAKGVVTALASIPPQDVSGGVVQVRLVEGHVGKVSISGNDSTRESFIASRIGLAPGALVDLDRQEQALVWFNRTNDARLEAELKPGQQLGTTDVQITTIEPQQHQVQFTLDNLGSDLTGKWRLGGSYRNRSLLGFRDDLSLSYTGAGGQNSWAFGYGFPVNRWGGRVNLSYYDDATSIKYGSLSSLHITGRSHADVLSLRQPVYVDSNLRLDLTAGAKKRDSSNYVDGVFLLRTDTSDGSLGAEIEGSDDKRVWGASYTHSQGTAKVLGASTHFNIDRGSARYSYDFDNKLSLRSSFSGQLARDKNLVSSEQFFLGGEGSVRGYAAGTYSGDQGYTLNLELHHPIGNLAMASHELATSGFFFADYGFTQPFRPPSSVLPANEHLGGIGWGLNTSIDRSTNIRLTFSHGLDKVPLAANRNFVVTLQLVASLF